MPNDPYSKPNTDKPQVTREQLSTMHWRDINQARLEGRLRDLAAVEPRTGAQGKDWR